MINNPDTHTGKTPLKRLIKLHGKDDPFPGNHTLKAGALTMQYESGSIRNISAGGTEIIRMVYAAVRDQQWLTVQPEIINEKISRSKRGFSILIESRYTYQDIDFRASYTIKANSDNHFSFEMNGKAFSTFKKNRIGFCVLHPITTCAGLECIITHPDGTQSEGTFPRAISPHQPFRNITAMQWKINDHVAAILRFKGDVFETEDQRNWTDASFKTYSTPLEIPFPVEVKKGTTIFQRIELDILGGLPEKGIADKKVIFQFNTDRLIPMPVVGLGISSRPQPLSVKEADQLKSIGFSHLRAELYLINAYFENQYVRIAADSSLLKLPVELCLFFGKEIGADLQLFLHRYYQHPLQLKSIILLSQHQKTTPRELIELVAPIIRKELGGVPLGAGTNCNFAQLNRSRPDPEAIDFISFAIHPQEHAGDDKSLFENMAAQMNVVETARQFAGHKPVHVSPVTLRRRFNANISNYEIPADYKEMPPQVDVRQMSLAGAAWTTGSLKYLFESGVESVTYYETAGERGIMMGEHGSQWPRQFPAKKGMLFPVFQVFRVLLQKTNKKVVWSFSNKPLLVDGFTVLSDSGGLVFLANMTNRPQQVKIAGIRKFRTLLTMNSRTFNQVVRPGSLLSNRTFSTVHREEDVLHMQPYETRILQFIHR